MSTLSKILLLFTILFTVKNSATAQQPGDTVTFSVDTAKSCLEWFCDSHNGTVPLKNGVIKTVNKNIAGGFFVINMDSLQDKDITYELMRQTLHNTLKSEFFFDVKNYPTATFIIDHAIRKKDNRFEITGDLWIKGMVNCITFNSKVAIAGNTLTAESEKFFIDRTRWGITIYSKQEAESDDSVIVSDEIYFIIRIFAEKP